jgi:NTP pyrophosphatase (non-canonical NTP hydrolase)
MHLAEIMTQSYANARAHGFRDAPRHFSTEIALIHSELSEALEAAREDEDMTRMNLDNGKPLGVPSEMADVVIRVCECCQHWGIDLEAAVQAKMAYNVTRPHCHGKLF